MYICLYAIFHYKNEKANIQGVRKYVTGDLYTLYILCNFRNANLRFRNFECPE